MQIVKDGEMISYAIISGKDIVTDKMTVSSFNKLCRKAKAEGECDALKGYNYCVTASDGVKYFFNAKKENPPIMPKPAKKKKK